MRRTSVVMPLLAVLGVAVGLGLVAVLAAPRVASVSPPSDAASVSALAPIEITFTQPMNAASVQEHFSLTGETPGNFEWQGNTLLFKPRGGWVSGSAITVRLAAGARSARGLPLFSPREWTFTVGQPKVAFLLSSSGDTGQLADLWFVPITGGQPAQITQEKVGVYDFGPSPDGTQIVYSALRSDGGADLRVVGADGGTPSDLLLCPGEACVTPAWSPDGASIAFERHPLRAGLTGDTLLGDPAMWLLDLAAGQARPLADTPGNITGSPRWSPDGSRLAYYDRTLQAIAVHDFKTGAISYIPATSGEMGSWSADGTSIVFPEILFSGSDSARLTPASPGAAPAGPSEDPDEDRFYSHLLQVIVATNETRDLSGEPLVEDLSAAYSPSGDWIAFARKFVDERWTPGRQLWLMKADGSNQHALTADPNHNHSAILWSRDGKTLIFQRFEVTRAAVPAEIWAMNADGSEAHLLVSGGYLPAWLP